MTFSVYHKKYLKTRILSILYFFLIISYLYGQNTNDMSWWILDSSDHNYISGSAWSNECKSIFHRLPERLESKVRKPVWKLSKEAAGLSIRFWSNSSKIVAKYNLAESLAMPHMPATGVSGMDLYSKTKDGEWLRLRGNYSFGEETSLEFNIDTLSSNYRTFGREYQLFLPLYNEVKSLEIGYDNGAFITPLKQRHEKPVVAYGTSICQGACASRPAMAWTNILERKLERPLINLGFSGNGRLEPELVELMTEIDAAIYILDCLPNLNPDKDMIYDLIINAVQTLKENQPQVPIILTAHIGYANASTDLKLKLKTESLNESLKSAYDQLLADGIKGLYLIDKEELGLAYDSYVDHIHPNDIGMNQYADAYEHLIRKILNEDIGSITTTIPVTQARDIAVYKWEERHQDILKRNKIDPPKIGLIGNSIVQFWGGSPESKVVNGGKSWNLEMEQLGVRNFGFGWDRIENVLWRIYHDELSSFDAKQILVMIGTNNLHLNSDEEIIQGLDKLISAIKIRQGKSRIVLIGILPRRENESRIEKLNLLYKDLATTKNIEYFDIGSDFKGNSGQIDESLFLDGLHPNEKGYSIMADKLKMIISDH